MEVANVRVRLNKVGSDVPVFNVTPAEAMFLHILHGRENGGLTFGEEFTKIELIGQAMVQTGEQKKVIDKPATEAVYDDQIVEPAVPAQTIKGKVIKVAIPEQKIAAIGTLGNAGYVAERTIPAQAEDREPDVVVPAKHAVIRKVVVKEAQEEVSHLEPVLRVRTDAEELRRLASKYNGARNKKNEPILDSIWPDKLNPKLPQTFKEIKWTDVSTVGAGVEVGNVNYATGALATTSLPTK